MRGKSRLSFSCLCLSLMMLGSAALLRADDDDGPPIPLPHRVYQENGVTVVKLSPDEQVKAGVRVAAFVAEDLKPTAETFASVEDIRGLIADQEAFALAKTNVESAKAALDNALAEYRRAQALGSAEGYLSTEQLQAAEKTWLLADAALKAAKIPVVSLRANLGRKWGTVIEGWIEGTGEEMGRLAQGRDVLVRVAIPDGVAVDAKAPACLLRRSGGRWVGGNPVSPATTIDPAFQSASYYFLVPSSEGLVPGQTLPARLAEAGAEQHGVRVPAAAVVWWQGAAWVYMEERPGVFTRAALAGGTPQAGGDYFVRTLPATAKLVTSGADVLLSEETRPAAAPDAD